MSSLQGPSKQHNDRRAGHGPASTSQRRPPRSEAPQPIESDIVWEHPDLAAAAVRGVAAFTKLRRTAEKVEWLCQAASQIASQIAHERKAAASSAPQPSASASSDKVQPQPSACLAMWAHARLFEWVVGALLSDYNYFPDTLVSAAADLIAAFRNPDAVFYAVSFALESITHARSFSTLASMVYFVCACVDDVINLCEASGASAAAACGAGGASAGRADQAERMKAARHLEFLQLLEDTIATFAELLSSRLPYRDEAGASMAKALGVDRIGKSHHSPRSATPQPAMTPGRREDLVNSVPRLDLGAVSPQPRRKPRPSLVGIRSSSPGGLLQAGNYHRQQQQQQQSLPHRSVEVGGASRATESTVGRVMTFRIPKAQGVGSGNPTSFPNEELARRRMVEALLSLGHKAGQMYVTGDLSTLLSVKAEYEARRGGAMVPIDQLVTGTQGSAKPKKSDSAADLQQSTTSVPFLGTSSTVGPRSVPGGARAIDVTMPGRSEASSDMDGESNGLHSNSIYEARARRSTILGSLHGANTADHLGSSNGGPGRSTNTTTSRPLLTSIVTEVVASVAAHQRAGWTAPYDTSFLLTKLLDALAARLVEEFPEAALRSQALMRAEEALIAAAQLPTLRSKNLHGSQLDTPTICIAEQAITACTQIAAMNDVKLYRATGHPCTGLTWDGFGRDALPFAPVVFMDRVSMSLRSLVKRATGADGTVTAATAKRLPVVEASWHLATMNGFLAHWRDSSSTVPMEAARVCLPAVETLIACVVSSATFSYAPSDPFVMLTHQLLDLLDTVLSHTHPPPLVLEATLRLATDRSFARIVQASMHNVFRAGSDAYSSTQQGLNGTGAAPLGSAYTKSLDAALYSSPNTTPAATPMTGHHLDAGATPVSGLSGAGDAAALLAMEDGTFQWPDCPSMRKVARRLVLHAQAVARHTSSQRPLGDRDLIVSFCDPYTGPALHTLAAPVGATPFDQAVVLTLLQSQLSGRKRARAFLAGQRSAWAASFMRFLYLTFLQTFHSPEFTPKHPKLETHAIIAAASLKTIRLLLMWGNADSRAAARRLGIVPTLARECDLEHNIHERRAQELRRTTTAMSRFGTETSLREPSQNSSVRPNAPASAADPTHLSSAQSAFASSLQHHAAAAGVDSTITGVAAPLKARGAGSSDDDDDDEDEDDVRSPMGLSKTLNATAPPEAGAGGASKAEVAAPVPAPAPVRRGPPMIPKLSLGGASLPLYFTAKGGDTGLAAENAIFQPPSNASSSSKQPSPMTAGGPVLPPPPPPRKSDGTPPPALPPSSEPSKKTPQQQQGRPELPRLASTELVVSLNSSEREEPPQPPLGMLPPAMDGIEPPRALMQVAPDGGGYSQQQQQQHLPAPMSYIRRVTPHSSSAYLFDKPSVANVSFHSAGGNNNSTITGATAAADNTGASSHSVSVAKDDSDDDEGLSATMKSDIGGAMELLNHSLYPTGVLDEASHFLDLHRRFRRAYLSPAVHAEMVLCLLAGLLSPRGPVEAAYADAYAMTAQKVNLVYFVEAHIRHSGNNAFLGVELRRMCAASGHPALQLLVSLLTPYEQFDQRYQVGAQVGSGAYGNIFECSAASGRTTGVQAPASLRAMEESGPHGFDDDDDPSSSQRRQSTSITFAPTKDCSAAKLVVKRIPVAQHAQDRVAVVRVHAEALAMSLVSDLPGMCRVHDVGNTGSHYCLVMPQYVETMQGWCARLQKAAIAPPVMLRLALTRLMEIVSALQGLHDRRIVHGDLKADNVFLDNSDAIAIGDFGDCEFVVRSEIRAAAAATGASATGRSNTGGGGGEASGVADSDPSQRTSLLPAMLGTEAIRAPELVVPHRYNDRRKRQSTATRYLRDVWSVGCLLYELLTGQMLFGSEDAGEMLHRITDESAPLVGKEQRRELQHALGHHSESMLDAALAHVEQLLGFIVVRDPTRRPSLREVKSKMAETLHGIPSAPVRSLGLPDSAHAALRPAWIGNTVGAQQVSWVTFAAAINWDVARTDARMRRLAAASTKVPFVAEGAAPRHVSSRRGTLIDTPAPSTKWADSATASIRRCFGVVHPGLLLTAQPGQPSLHALSAVRATHLVSFVPPLPTVANAMPCFSLAGAVTALFPDIDVHDAAEANGYGDDAGDEGGDSGRLAGGDVSLRSDNSEAQGRKLAAESAFAAHIKAAVDFITVAHVTRGTTVITAFIVDTVDIGLVLALVFITKTYGIAPCNALPFSTLLMSAVRPSGFEQSLDYGLTVALAERCLMFLVVPDCSPGSPEHVFYFNNPPAAAASPRVPPAYGGAGRATSRYQCLCASHVWRLPAEALTSNVVIDAPSSRLIPGDVLPRMTVFALIANLAALYAPALVQTLFDSGTIHVATMSRFDVSNIGIQQLIPQGPSVRIRQDADGALVFCRECGLPMIYVPADGSDAGRTFGLVMLCLLPHASHDVRSDHRQSSWLGKMPAALSQAASFAMH